MKWYSTKHGLGDIIGPIRVQYILAMSSELTKAAAYVLLITANAWQFHCYCVCQSSVLRAAHTQHTKPSDELHLRIQISRLQLYMSIWQ